MIERGKTFYKEKFSRGCLLAGLGIYSLSSVEMEYTSDFGPGPVFFRFGLA